MKKYQELKVDSVWNKNHQTLEISGFKKFSSKDIPSFIEGDILHRGIVVAERNLDKIFKGMYEKKSISIPIGYKPGRIHLGYSILREIIQNFSQYSLSKFYALINVSESIRENNKSLERVLCDNEGIERILFRDLLNNNKLIRIYDLPYLNDENTQTKFYNLKRNVSKTLRVKDFKKIMRWNEGSCISQYDEMINTLSGLIYPSLVEKITASLIITDIKHIPFVRLINLVCNKIGMEPPSFMIIDALPSLKENLGRMSGKGNKNTLYLDFLEEANKFLKVKTGGRSLNEQRKKGGNPSLCHALKIISFLESEEDIENIIMECKSGKRYSCYECKKEMTRKFIIPRIHIEK